MTRSPQARGSSILIVVIISALLFGGVTYLTNISLTAQKEGRLVEETQQASDIFINASLAVQNTSTCNCHISSLTPGNTFLAANVATASFSLTSLRMYRSGACGTSTPLVTSAASRPTRGIWIKSIRFYKFKEMVPGTSYQATLEIAYEKKRRGLFRVLKVVNFDTTTAGGTVTLNACSLADVGYTVAGDAQPGVLPVLTCNDMPTLTPALTVSAYCAIGFYPTGCVAANQQDAGTNLSIDLIQTGSGASTRYGCRARTTSPLATALVILTGTCCRIQ